MLARRQSPVSECMSKSARGATQNLRTRRESLMAARPTFCSTGTAQSFRLDGLTSTASLVYRRTKGKS